MGMIEVVGCRVHLNPNGSDLRCGDRVNNFNWNEDEGYIQLCQVCSLRKQNSALIEMLSKKNDSNS